MSYESNILVEEAVRYCDGTMDGITDATDMNLGKLRDKVRNGEAWCAEVRGAATVGHDWVIEQH